MSMTEAIKQPAGSSHISYANHTSRIKMNLRFSWWIFALLLLILEGDNGMPIAAEIAAENTENHSHSPHSHMDHSVLVFFTPDNLKLGKTMPIYFRSTNSSSSPHFLPKDEAESIPFSPSELPFLLELFGFPRGSPQSKAIEDTLRQCQVPPIQGESKFCATSLESMLEFVRSMLNAEFRGLNTRHVTKTGANRLRNYTIIEEPKEVFAPKMVACHTMPYPYAVLYCHYQESESKVFEVMLRGEEDESDLVEAIAVCHMDTSQWSRNHVSFKVLGIEPGSSPVCHFFPADNLVWVPLFNQEHGYEQMVRQM